jgi:hypothetical protein
MLARLALVGCNDSLGRPLDGSRRLGRARPLSAPAHRDGDGCDPERDGQAEGDEAQLHDALLARECGRVREPGQRRRAAPSADAPGDAHDELAGEERRGDELAEERGREPSGPREPAHARHERDCRERDGDEE